MKLKIIGLFLAIISAIVAVIQIIKWTSSHNQGPIPIIEICYDRERIYLPSEIVEAFSELNNRFPLNYESLSLLEELKKSVGDQGDKFKIDFLINTIKKLTSIRGLELRQRPEVFILQVKNLGKNAAHNLKILFPCSGYVEVHLRGNSIVRENVADAYVFDKLQPDDTASMYFWPPYSMLTRDEIKASHDNGTAKVIKGCN